MLPLTLTIGIPFYDFVMLGQIALIIIAVVFFTSAVFRRYMPFDLWYGIHLLSYVLFSRKYEVVDTHKVIEDKVPSHEFDICGPPMMTLKLEKQLRSENVDSKHIHHELFNY